MPEYIEILEKTRSMIMASKAYQKYVRYVRQRLKDKENEGSRMNGRWEQKMIRILNEESALEKERRNYLRRKNGHYS